MTDPNDPHWFVAHKEGYWCGIASSTISDIGKWLGRWAKDGFTITTVHTRAEFNALLDSLKSWDERPKKSKAASPQKELL